MFWLMIRIENTTTQIAIRIAGCSNDQRNPSAADWYFTFRSRAMRFARTCEYSGSSERLFDRRNVITFLLIGGLNRRLDFRRRCLRKRIGHFSAEKPGENALQSDGAILKCARDRSLQLDRHQRERVFRLGIDAALEVSREPSR